MLELKNIKLEKPEEVNMILGQAHFIKTVEDMYETLIASSPQIKFGIAFCESSGACKVRSEGNDAQLKKMAQENCLKLGSGHSFIILIKEAYPINVLNAIKNIPEVCTIFSASANPLEVIVAETQQGRGILGVIDGARPVGIESPEDISWRKNLLRKIGYKL
jgi:adenosine/AMP kinase